MWISYALQRMRFLGTAITVEGDIIILEGDIITLEGDIITLEGYISVKICLLLLNLSGPNKTSLI